MFVHRLTVVGHWANREAENDAAERAGNPMALLEFPCAADHSETGMREDPAAMGCGWDRNKEAF